MPSQNLNSKSSGVKGALKKLFSPWRVKRDKKKQKADDVVTADSQCSPIHRDANSSMSPTPCTSSPSQGSTDRLEFGSRSMPHKSFMSELESKLSTHPSRESCSSSKDVKSMESWGSVPPNDSPVCQLKTPKTSDLANVEYYRSTNLMSDVANHKLAVSRQRNRRPPSVHPLRSTPGTTTTTTDQIKPDSQDSDFFAITSAESSMTNHKSLDSINEECEYQLSTKSPNHRPSSQTPQGDDSPFGSNPTPIAKTRTLPSNSTSPSPPTSTRPTSICDLGTHPNDPQTRSHSSVSSRKSSNSRPESTHFEQVPSPAPRSRTLSTVATPKPDANSAPTDSSKDQLKMGNQPCPVACSPQNGSHAPTENGTRSGITEPSSMAKLVSPSGFGIPEVNKSDSNESKCKYLSNTKNNRNSVDSKVKSDSTEEICKPTTRPSSQGDIVPCKHPHTPDSRSNTQSPSSDSNGTNSDEHVSVASRAAAFGPVKKHIRKSEPNNRYSCHIQPESVVVRRPRPENQPSPPAEYRRSCVMDLVKTFQQMDQ